MRWPTRWLPFLLVLAALAAASPAAGRMNSSAHLLLRTKPLSAQAELRAANQTIRHARDVLSFLRDYPQAGTVHSRWMVRRDHRWLLRLGLSKRAEALGRLSPWPPHHRLWLCIHGGEGAWHDRDSGGNGHWGGLQMHPGWGYGTSYYASDDSQYVQEWAAERGYRANGFSRGWLVGQWGATIGPCWQYA